MTGTKWSTTECCDAVFQKHTKIAPTHNAFAEMLAVQEANQRVNSITPPYRQWQRRPHPLTRWKCSKCAKWQIAVLAKALDATLTTP
jgi:hypothetical protein